MLIFFCQLSDYESAEREIVFVGGFGLGFVVIVALLPIVVPCGVSKFEFGLLGSLGKGGVEFTLSRRELGHIPKARVVAYDCFAVSMSDVHIAVAIYFAGQFVQGYI